MEKRKDAAGYQHQCFTMMVLLNVIIVLFLTFTIVLTQYRVAAAQEAQKFIGTLKVMPERPEQRIIMVVFSLFFLCGIIYYKRKNEAEGKEKVLLWNVFEIIFLIFVLKELDMSYNGVIFLVVADMLTYVEDRKNKLIFLFIAFLCYMVCSYNLVTMFIPLNSFETWAAFYDWNTERIFLSVKTICEITNMVLFLIYIVILMMKDRRERERIKLLNEQLQKANEQLHEFAQEKELMGETKERNRLAREIHDTLGHILTGISVGIDAVLVLMDIAPDKAKEQLEGIGDTARRGLQDVRRSVRKLKPDALERMSLNNAIHQMIEDMSKVTNTKIYFVSYMEELEFEADEEEVIYRIIQESTTNAIRHGKATEIWIRISEKDEELIIIISDNGCGCESIKEGFGLKHIRERVELLNGEVNYQGMIGFTIIAKIPIRNKLTGKKDRDELNNLADNNDKAKDSQ